MEIQNNQLHLGGLSAEALRINFGSPLYVYEEDSLRSQCRRLLNCFEELHQQQRLQLHFAMKANSNPSILKILREEGAWIDAVSPYEVQLALDCGYRPEQILFTGNNTAPEELDFCVENGVSLNIGSLLTLEHFGKRY
ncbi:MAG: diaminopimelate decarboxylase, partial [SAR324 cluster bacterium]|nr:diaminopimelate decarboxylase [SAR324 cluster bacterium]